MTSPTLAHAVCPHPDGQHRRAYWQWGPPQAAHTVVCVHGLTRQGRDFDRLAQALLAQRSGLRIVCPDVAGRGHSERLPQGALYQVPQYASDMLVLLAQLHSQAPIATLDWVGTSMGGLVGMVLAGQPGLPLPAPLRRLVLNDVGPVTEWPAIERMQQYVGRYGRYDSPEQAAQALRAVSRGFGPVPDALWLELSLPMLRPHPEGGWTLHYDPAIGEPVRALTEAAAVQAQAALWALYDQIQARTLLIRGADSEVLSPATAQAMTERGPRAQCLTWPGVGHAPTLTDPDHMAQVVDFLLGP